jgi:hypothetical protein
VIEVLPGAPPSAEGAAGDVRIAADHDATWGEVTAAADAVTRRGGRAHLAVLRRRELVALTAPEPPAAGKVLRLVATGGKACLSFPDVLEALCVSRFDGKHVDRAHTREAIRKLVAEHGFTQVQVAIDPALSWGDAVRAIDAARTCCAGNPMSVSVETF